MKKQIILVCIYASITVAVAINCDTDRLAVYEVTLNTSWSEERFPKDYPGMTNAQWSIFYGQTHSPDYVLYKTGEIASTAVRKFTQFGDISDITREADESDYVYDQFTAPAIVTGVGSTEGVIIADSKHSFISLMCRMVPSPDWFVGVENFSLCLNSNWIDSIILELHPLDVGGASGDTFTSQQWPNNHIEPVGKIKPNENPTSAFYYPELTKLPNIATVQIQKIKEVSSKDIWTKIKKQIRDKIYDTNIDEIPEEISDIKLKDISKADIQLGGLLEDYTDVGGDAFDTGKIVVVREKKSNFQTDVAIDKTDDDIILAIANGKLHRKGNHLPRHFNHRLSKAVNRITDEDCLVSEWSKWTQCSKTCGVGEKSRSRYIIRQPFGSGRECPQLMEFDYCGHVGICN